MLLRIAYRMFDILPQHIYMYISYINMDMSSTETRLARTGLQERMIIFPLIYTDLGRLLVYNIRQIA